MDTYAALQVFAGLVSRHTETATSVVVPITVGLTEIGRSTVHRCIVNTSTIHLNKHRSAAPLLSDHNFQHIMLQIDTSHT